MTNPSRLLRQANAGLLQIPVANAAYRLIRQRFTYSPGAEDSRPQPCGYNTLIEKQSRLEQFAIVVQDLNTKARGSAVTVNNYDWGFR